MHTALDSKTSEEVSPLYVPRVGEGSSGSRAGGWLGRPQSLCWVPEIHSKEVHPTPTRPDAWLQPAARPLARLFLPPPSSVLLFLLCLLSLVSRVTSTTEMLMASQFQSESWAGRRQEATERKATQGVLQRWDAVTSRREKYPEKPLQDLHGFQPPLGSILTVKLFSHPASF